MKKCAKKIPVLWSPNMSIGANLLKEIAAESAYKLGSDFDIDVTDIHHKKKRDVPSGTAISIKEKIEKKLKEKNIKKKINISSIRAGDSTGEHSVIFSGKGEKIIFKLGYLEIKFLVVPGKTVDFIIYIGFLLRFLFLKKLII